MQCVLCGGKNSLEFILRQDYSIRTDLPQLGATLLQPLQPPNPIRAGQSARTLRVGETSDMSHLPWKLCHGNV